MRTKFLVLIISVLSLLAVIMAEGADTNKPTSLKGTVAEIKDTIVVVKDKDGKKNKVPTDDKTEVIIEGKQSKVSNLVSGMEVTVTPPKGVATRIEVTKK